MVSVEMFGRTQPLRRNSNCVSLEHHTEYKDGAWRT